MAFRSPCTYNLPDDGLDPLRTFFRIRTRRTATTWTYDTMVCILTERPLAGWDLNFIQEKCTRAGLARSEVEFLSLAEAANASGLVTVLVPLGEVALTRTTGLRSLGKWHLSPLEALPEFSARKVIPTYSPAQVKAQWELGLYVEKALIRAREEHATREYVRKEKRFLLNPSLEETYEVLDRIRDEPHLSIDIETGRGQINTLGIAWSESDAIAIGVLPERFSGATHYELWTRIARLLESESRKICQNGIYEILYLARYGIRMRNLWHDTMVCQKFLWPELDKGLDNVGRLYTRECYWKDDGRVASVEGAKKDWGAIRDWVRHYDYNCKDTSNTFEAAFAQRADLVARGQLSLFDNYIMKLHEPVQEMCLRGFPVCAVTQKALIAEYEARSAELMLGLSKQINPRSSKQKIALFEEKGYSIPKVRDKLKGGSRKSVNELSLKKLRLKYPEDNDITTLLEVAHKEKALSSYLRVQTDPLDGNVRYSLDIHGTETGRFACYKDPWDRGFNVQTMTKTVKRMIEWQTDRSASVGLGASYSMELQTSENQNQDLYLNVANAIGNLKNVSTKLPESCGRQFVQIDLKQAESRFVAYDSCDENLISALDDTSRDIHSEVAAEIFGCSVEQVREEHAAGNSGKRQLGKKSGHGANYDMAATTFQESCLKELNLVITKPFAEKTLAAYHRLFPNIQKWHKGIRDTIYRERRLTNPFGRVRYFYGRMDPATFREGYAYRPQSTVPDIVNHLMLRLCEERSAGKMDFWLHCQVHDSIILSTQPQCLDTIAEYCLATSKWHPEIILPAGRLIIPTSIEVGQCLGSVHAYKRR